MNEQTKNNLITDVMLTKGRAVERDSYGDVSPYGWADYDLYMHLRDGECSLLRSGDTEVKDTNFITFIDTMHGNETEYGVNAKGINGGSINCACGEYRDLEIRYVGKFSDLLMSVLDNIDL